MVLNMNNVFESIDSFKPENKEMDYGNLYQFLEIRIVEKEKKYQACFMEFYCCSIILGQWKAWPKWLLKAQVGGQQFKVRLGALTTW